MPELRTLERVETSGTIWPVFPGNMPPAAGGDNGGGWQAKKTEKRACMCACVVVNYNTRGRSPMIVLT